MIADLLSLQGFYCSDGQAADCWVRQSSCFSLFSVGLLPTEGLSWNTKALLFYFNLHTVHLLQNIILLHVIIFSVLLFFFQGNFTASLTTVTDCLVTPRGRGRLLLLLPLRSQLRCLYLLIFFTLINASSLQNQTVVTLWFEESHIFWIAGKPDAPNSDSDRGRPQQGGGGGGGSLGWDPALRYQIFLCRCGGCVPPSGRGGGSPSARPPLLPVLDLSPGGAQPLRFSLPLHLLHLPLLLFHCQHPSEPPLAWNLLLIWSHSVLVSAH